LLRSTAARAFVASAITQSMRPSPSRSPTAICHGAPPHDTVALIANVPVPLPSSTVTSCEW
jgi:hypothetical protein